MYVVEISPLHPSKILAQIKCETKAKEKIIKVIKLTLKNKLKNVLIENKKGKNKKDEKTAEEEKINDFVEEVVENISKDIIEQATTQDIFIDEVNEVIYCYVFIPTNHNLKNKIIKSIREVGKKEEYSNIAEKSAKYIETIEDIFSFR